MYKLQLSIVKIKRRNNINIYSNFINSNISKFANHYFISLAFDDFNPYQVICRKDVAFPAGRIIDPREDNPGQASSNNPLQCIFRDLLSGLEGYGKLMSRFWAYTDYPLHLRHGNNKHERKNTYLCSNKVR